MSGEQPTTRVLEVEIDSGDFVCRIPGELVSDDWRECQAFRFVREGDDVVRLEFALDLDALTAPENSDAS